MARIQNTFNELLARKERIEGRSIPRREVARVTGLSLSSIQSWAVNGVNRFDGKAIVALCKYLNCSVSDLLIIEDTEDTEINTPLAVAV